MLKHISPVDFCLLERLAAVACSPAVTYHSLMAALEYGECVFSSSSHNISRRCTSLSHRRAAASQPAQASQTHGEISLPVSLERSDIST